MPPSSTRYLLILLIALLFPPVASAALSVPLGDEIPLIGTSTGSQVVYLFLTGPNLPSNGVRLLDGAPVVTGSSPSFTRVDVQTDNTWRYEWDTGGLGGIIDVGSYVVYVVGEPAGKEDLAGKVYATIDMTLTEPSLSVVTVIPSPATTGTMAISTAPTTPTTQAPAITTVRETSTPPAVPPVPGILPLAALLVVAILAAATKR